MLGLALFLATLLGFTLLSRWLARLSITPQLALLSAGVVLALVQPGDAAIAIDEEVLRVVGEVALVMALFVDASRSDIPALRRAAVLPIRLLAIGLPLTIAAGWLLAAVLIPDLDPAGAFVLAVLVAPTDAALGAVVVNSPAVPVRIRQAINVESGLNDGLVTPLVLLGVAVAAAEGQVGGADWIVDALVEVTVGAGVGVVIGAGGGTLLRVSARRGLVVPSARWAVVPVLALMSWSLALMLGGNVFVAAFVAGLCLAIVHGPIHEAFQEFAEGLGELAGLAVFFLLGAIVVSIPALEPAILLFAVLALTVVRMLPVTIALIRSGLTMPSVAFIGWFGPRGLATIVLGLMALGDGLPRVGESPLIGAVAATVALSVIAHGLSSGPLVAWYGRYVATLPADAPEHGESIEIATRVTSLRLGRAATIDRGPSDRERPDEAGRSG